MKHPAAREHSPDVSQRLLLAVIAAGAALRFLMLGRQSFWYDEAVSAQFAAASVADLVTGRVHDLGNPPLHGILLSLWSRIFGPGDASLRALSATAGVAAIPVLHDVARRLVGGRVAIVAAALLALSPLQVYFAQEARTYALVTLLVLGSMALLLRLVEFPRRTLLWVAYGLTVFLAMYAHYFSAFAILAQLVWVLSQHRSNRALVGRLFAALVGAGLLYGVWLPVLIAQATTKGNLARAADTWYLHIMSTPLVFGVGTTLLWKETVTPLRLGASALAVIAFTGAALLGVRALWAKRQALVLVLAWLLFPVLFPLLISLALFPFFYVRYALLATPAFCILVAAGLCHVARGPRLALIAGIAVPSALSLFFYFTTLVKHDWRSVEAWVTARAKPGDVQAFDADIGETTFAHYAGPDDARIRLVPPANPDDTHFFGVSPKFGKASVMDPRLYNASRVWFVYSDPKVGAGTYYSTLFGQGFRLAESHAFRGVQVFLYEPRH